MSRDQPQAARRVEQDSMIVAVDVPAPGVERVTSPEQIHELLDFLARERVLGTVQTTVGIKNARIETIDADGLHFQQDVTDWVLPTSISFLHLNMVYQVPVTGKTHANAVPTPEWIGKVARRKSRRAPAPAGLSVRFSEPFSSEKLEAEVLDVSRRGLSFRASALSLRLAPGLPLAAFSLHHGEQEYGNFGGMVRNVRPTDDDQIVVGVSFEPHSTEDARLLGELLDLVLYPSTLGHASDVWNVFESSGYFNLSGKTPADFEPLREPFLRVARALESVPGVGTIAHWPAVGPVEATVSNLKVYQSTWLLLGVSKRKGKPSSGDGRQGMRELYLRTYEAAQADADTRWLLGYVQDTAPRWSREIHVELPKRYVHTGEACLLPFRALEVDVVDLGPPPDGPELRVLAADEAMARGAVRDLTRVRPAQYLDALDLTEARCNLSELRSCWGKAGLDRDRQIFVAYRGDVRCAMAVVEVAEPGAHLYGLLDCLRMYPLRPGGEWAFGGLLRAAHRWYRARGRTCFAYFEEYPRTLPLRELGFRDLGGATFTLLSVDRLPELLQRTSEMASERPSARRVG